MIILNRNGGIYLNIIPPFFILIDLTFSKSKETNKAVSLITAGKQPYIYYLRNLSPASPKSPLITGHTSFFAFSANPASSSFVKL